MKKTYVVCNNAINLFQVHSHLVKNILSKIENSELVELRITNLFRRPVEYFDFNRDGKNYTAIRVRSLLSFNDILNKDCVVINMFSERIGDWPAVFVIKLNDSTLIGVSNIGIMDLSSGCFLKSRGNMKSSINDIIVAAQSFFLKARRKLSAITFRFLVCLNVFKKTDVFFSSNRLFVDRKLCNKYRKIIYINSMFYDEYLDYRYEVREDCIVFLDSMIPYHMDQINLGYEAMDRSLYYNNLNSFFDLIEFVSNKRVVVCAHPKYEIENAAQDFNGRMVVQGRAQYYIAISSLVLFHETTSVNSAFIYKKRVVQLTTDLFNDYVKYNMCIMRKKFGFEQLDFVNSDQDQIRSLIHKPFDIDKKVCGYVDKYIAASGKDNVTGYSQVIDFLVNNYGLLLKKME